MAIPTGHQRTVDCGCSGFGYAVPRGDHACAAGVGVRCVAAGKDRMEGTVAAGKLRGYVEDVAAGVRVYGGTKRTTGGCTGYAGGCAQSAVGVMAVQTLVDHDGGCVRFDGGAAQVAAEAYRGGVGGCGCVGAGSCGGTAVGDAFDVQTGVGVTEVDAAVAVAAGTGYHVAGGRVAFHVADDAVSGGDGG